MKQLSILCLFLLGLNSLFAQDQLESVEDVQEEMEEESSDIQSAPFSRFILKWSVNDVSDNPAPMLRFVLEHRLNQRHALEYSLGAGSTSFLSSINNTSLKARLGYRYYFKRKGYFSLQSTYKYSTRSSSLAVCRSNCAFYENVEDKYRSHMIGATLNLGRQNLIADRWTLDYGFGFGVAHYSTSYGGISDSELVLEEMPLFTIISHPTRTIGKRLWPYMVLQFKVGYIL